MSSLPVPVSPRMQTRVSLAATFSICAMIVVMAWPVQISSCFPKCWRSSLFSDSNRCSLRAFSTVSRSFSVEIGFSKKSRAPSLVARTAISMWACPDIITTGVATSSDFNSCRSHSPSLPGITTSESTRSKRCALARSSAFAALSQTTTSCPARRKAREREARVLASSSTTKRCAFCVTDFSSSRSARRSAGLLG